jgi:hypothetical protein
MIGVAKDMRRRNTLDRLESSLAKAAGWVADDTHQRKGRTLNDLMRVLSSSMAL